MRIKHFLIFLVILFLSPRGFAEIKTYENTWFEIEVILLSQLGDKSQLKEVFPESSELPKYNNFIDILSSYVQPEIGNLKQQLPLCELSTHVLNNKKQELSLSYQQLNNNQVKLPPLFIEKSISDFEKIVKETVTMSLNDNSAIDNIITTEKDYSIEDLQNATREIDSSANNYSENTPIEPILPIPLTEQEIALVNQAEHAFNSMLFNVSSEEFPSELCVIAESFFNNTQPDHNKDTYNSIPVSEVDVTIDGTSEHTSDDPYIISENSLQLKGIVKQLLLSREFKPLLHIGWRQLTQNEKFAIPVKLFAGENLNYHYEKSLALYKKQLDEYLAQEKLINNILKADSLDNQQSANDLEIRKRIDLVLQQVKQPILDKNVLINSLDNEQFISTNNEPLMLNQAPLPPLQPWTIDGFITVDVDHYLHVTADFNVINMSVAEQATKRLQSDENIDIKSIRFQQNKRVISGEIHYFDNPYMGMIVQIRPYKIPEVVAELESF